jgi:HlyD family secretion protein
MWFPNNNVLSITDVNIEGTRIDMAKKLMKAWKYLFLVLIIAAFMFFYRKADSEVTSEKVSPVIPVRVTTPEYGTLEQIITMGGYIESEKTVTVLPKVQGAISSFSASTGDYLEKGGLIAVIDDEPYMLTLKQAEASFLAAEATYKRTNDLYKSGATSSQNYDQAKAQYDVAAAQYKSVQLNYKYTRITAPIAGTVIAVQASEGDLVGNQSPIVVIADLDDLVVKAKVPEKYYFEFYENREGIKTRVSLADKQERIFGGVLRTVTPYINPASKKFDVLVKLESEQLPLRPGMFVNIDFVIRRKENIYYLPYKTLIDNRYLWYAEDGRARRMEFEPDFQTESMFQVPESYSDLNFLIEGQGFVEEGQQIKLVEDGEY